MSFPLNMFFHCLVLPGYRQGYGADTQYKVNEIRRSNADATALCSQQFSLLIKCQTQAEVSFLQNIISSNKIMGKTTETPEQASKQPVVSP